MDILKIILPLFFIFPLEAANELEKKIYKKIATILLHKKNISISTSSDNCSYADIIFIRSIQDVPKECLNKPIVIVSNYKEYKKNRDKVIGIFFWQKGRAQILFNPKILKKFNIKIDRRYEKYLDE